MTTRYEGIDGEWYDGTPSGVIGASTNVPGPRDRPSVRDELNASVAPDGQ